MASTEKKSTTHPANNEAQTAEKIQRHLQRVHKIQTSEDFASELILAHRKFRSTPFYMDLKLVDSVVKACKYWQDYVVDWDDFVVNEVLSMAKLHTSVVCWHFLKKENIPLKKVPPIGRETIVAYTGAIKTFYIG